MKALSVTIQSAVAAIGLTLLVWMLVHLPYFSALEDETSDHLVSLRYWIDKQIGAHKTDPTIVVAAIDERTAQELGTWPLPRSIHGEFLADLAEEKPRVVGWDVFFTEHSAAQPGESISQNDEALVEGAGMVPAMVTAARRGVGTSDPLADLTGLLPTRPFSHVTGNVRNLLSASDAGLPFPELRKETYFGFADEAGRIRRVMPMVVNINGHVFPSFDCQVLMRYWHLDPDQVTVEIGHHVLFPQPGGKVLRVPIDQRGYFNLSYRAKLGDFNPMSYSQMGAGLSAKVHGQKSDFRDHLPEMKDKIVIIGVTVAGTDAGVTPLETVSPLVVAQLNVLNNVLQHDFLHVPREDIWLPAYGAVLFLLTLLMLHLRVIAMLAVALVAFVLSAIAAFALLYVGNLQVPLAMPEIGIILLGVLVPARGFFGEEREKAKIKSIMQAYLSDKVMQKILEHPDNLKLGGVKVEITIMFCDIRGFTSYCDERDPQETMDVLNEYMETMTQVVFDHEGTIDKYIGDCIMAFWNAPEPQPDHAERAVRCAMEMRNALGRFKARQHKVELQAFECGIGLHTGEALVGNMGSSLKRNYTAMGSTVNLGSRLESLTKRMKEHILISEDTFRRLTSTDLPIVDRGEEMVAGVGRPVHVYGVRSMEEFAAVREKVEAAPVPMA